MPRSTCGCVFLLVSSPLIPPNELLGWGGRLGLGLSQVLVSLRGSGRSLCRGWGGHTHTGLVGRCHQEEMSPPPSHCSRSPCLRHPWVLQPKSCVSPPGGVGGSPPAAPWGRGLGRAAWAASSTPIPLLPPPHPPKGRSVPSSDPPGRALKAGLFHRDTLGVFCFLTAK